MASNTDKCAHPSCLCPAKKGSKYCSTYCEAKPRLRTSFAVAATPGVETRERRELKEQDAPDSIGTGEFPVKPQRGCQRDVSV